MDANTQQGAQQQHAAKPSLFSNKKVLYGAILVLIIAVVIALVLTNGSGNAGSQLAVFDGQPVPQAIISQLAVPNSVAASVKTGFASNFPKPVNGTALVVNGKPEVLYMGAEYCPYCAIERWGLIIALMRFGNFTGIEYMTSSATDSFANTPTFTFVNSTYSSPYISFVPVEMVNNKINPSTGQYSPLQHPNSSEQAILSKYNPVGSIPFIDFANSAVQIGANYNDPTILDGRNWSTIAASANDPTSTISMAVVGAANIATAQICMLTNNTPASVCGQSYISTIETELG
ncbi:MAG: DUF929 domain-containing protein [Candidatus Marsarchaeota archaeon]|nr:DUF929 domain-containing protein [Candidatus Marsarchaeota archaeon]